MRSFCPNAHVDTELLCTVNMRWMRLDFQPEPPQMQFCAKATLNSDPDQRNQQWLKPKSICSTRQTLDQKTERDPDLVLYIWVI